MAISKNRGRTALTLAAAAGLALCGGCASVQFSEPGSLDGVSVKGAAGAPSQAVWLGTSGDYILWSIPLGSGAFRWNERTGKLETYTAFFQDHVGVDELQAALLKLAEGRNCDLADVAFFDSDSSYAGASYDGLIGMFFGTSSMGVSAVLVPRAAAGGN